MALARIIWVDDEIESLRSQQLFLENKGYAVQTFNNGFEAVLDNSFVNNEVVDRTYIKKKFIDLKDKINYFVL